MRNRALPATLGCIALILASLVFADASEGTMSFVVSMPQPTTHLYHVVFTCDGLKGKTQDFKMPVWAPGYYVIMDFPKDVLNFSASDGAGRPLAWEKTTKNDWRVETDGAASVSVSYDVYAFVRFCAESYLDDSQGFISPTGIFMHVAGRIDHPVTVAVRPAAGWTKVSTALDPVPGRPNSFFAPDFDVLYDSPILVGNQDVIPFSVRGVPLEFVGTDLGTFDRAKFVGDLSRIVEVSADLIGEIPYKRYEFISIGPGPGGLEHLSSTALGFDAAQLESEEGYQRWLAFVCHEYFHLYNVKRIRPIALGPFDYDKENYTRMLWVSEGFTVYYEDLLLLRAGLSDRDKTLERFRDNIRGYENIPGHLVESATEASFDTWRHRYGRRGNADNTTISYYDKGAALGMLLDLAIRHESNNRQSLDDVMRTLYRVYYKEKKRGFTDAEFRQACEEAAGAPLAEIFQYASTVKPIDYAKYLGYAGLAIDVGLGDSTKAYLGARTEMREGRLVVTGVRWGSPAYEAGLSEEDEIIAVDGVRVSAGVQEGPSAGPRPEGPPEGKPLPEILAQKRGEKVVILISRSGKTREIDATLERAPARSFAITPMPNPTPEQAATLKSWLGR